MKLKSILFLLSILVTIPLMLLGCNTQGTAELEKRIAELEEKLEKEDTEVIVGEMPVELEEETTQGKKVLKEETGPLVSEVTNLTNNEAQDEDPCWSPDGEKIIFCSDRDGDKEIYIMNADGSGQVNVSNNPEALDLGPAWSPDGEKIAYRSVEKPVSQIYTMNTGGSEKTNITNNPNIRDVSPAWSPDGEKIAFASNRTGYYEIYIMNADGSDMYQLTNNQGEDGSPAWSPDGEKIAFVSGVDGIGEMFVINVDGSGQINLNDDLEEGCGSPCWSPDGKRIAFTSDRTGNFEIYIMNSDGSDIYQLTDSPGQDNFPAWSPDGKRIAFTSDRFGNNEIFVINVKSEPTEKETGEAYKEEDIDAGLVKVPIVEEEGGYIEKDTYVGNGKHIYVGDTEKNNMCKGFVSFDITGFKDTKVTDAVLTFKSSKILNDPEGLGDLIIAAHWYGDNPLVMIDYESTGTKIQSFNTPDFKCGNGTLKIELQKAIDELNKDITRFQILAYFTKDSSNGNGITDGWEYNQEDITLEISVVE